MELHQLPFISTTHLTKEVAQQLTEQGNANPWVTCASWENGFFICTQTIDTSNPLVEVPKCLIDLRDWLVAKALPCSNGESKWEGVWVHLDQDAGVQDDLPAYDW